MLNLLTSKAVLWLPIHPLSLILGAIAAYLIASAWVGITNRIRSLKPSR